jgi:hypothetical protein
MNHVRTLQLSRGVSAVLVETSWRFGRESGRLPLSSTEVRVPIRHVLLLLLLLLLLLTAIELSLGISTDKTNKNKYT